MTSLRRDVHAALEVIEPPLGGMPERVVQTVLAEKHGRLRKERMVYRLRISVALVAAVLVVAVGVAAVMTWNALRLNTSPAAVSPTSKLATLELRPLQIHVYPSGAECAPGPFTPDGDTGTGPIFAFGSPGPTTAWGNYFDVYLFADSPIQGPILVRAIDVYRNSPLVFIGGLATGSIVGTDVVNGTEVTQHAEAVVYEDASALAANAPYKAAHKYAWDVKPGIPSISSGSTGWQIDAKNFTEVFYVC